MNLAPVHFLLCASLLLFTMLLASCDLPGSSGTTSSGTNWSFTLEQVNDHATLEMDGVTIVFENEKLEGSSSGSLPVSGRGSSQVTVGGGDRTLESNYTNGVNSISFRDYQFELIDEGNTLSIQETLIDLSNGKKVVTVKDDGTVADRTGDSHLH